MNIDPTYIPSGQKQKEKNPCQPNFKNTLRLYVTSTYSEAQINKSDTTMMLIIAMLLITNLMTQLKTWYWQLRQALIHLRPQV